MSEKNLVSDLGKQHVFEDLLLLDRFHKKISKSVPTSPALSGEENVSSRVGASSIPNLRWVNVSVPEKRINPCAHSFCSHFRY